MAIVTLQQFKNYAGIDHEASDDDITLILASAEQALEARLKKRFITASVTEIIEQFPRYSREIRLGWRPFGELTSIVYYDSNDEEQTFPVSRVVIDTISDFPRLILKQAYSFPDARGIFAGKVTYTAGYGASADDVPARFKETVLKIARRWYDGLPEKSHGQFMQTLPGYGAVDILIDELQAVREDIPARRAHWDVSR